jgi:hypothetical protein
VIVASGWPGHRPHLLAIDMRCSLSQHRNTSATSYYGLSFRDASDRYRSGRGYFVRLPLVPADNTKVSKQEARTNSVSGEFR